MSSNWAASPLNKRDQTAANALPQLLFSQCRLNCLDDVRAEPNDSQRLCISNCQSKTYAAFDLYMQIRTKTEAQKDWRQHVDVSRFTGMESEHGHDTQNIIGTKQGVHVQTATLKDYNAYLQKGTADLSAKAL